MQGLYRLASQDNFIRKTPSLQQATPSQRKTSANQTRSIDQIPTNALEKFYLYKQKKNDVRFKQQMSKGQQRPSQILNNKFFINAKFNNLQQQQKRHVQSVTVEGMESVKRNIKTDMGAAQSVLAKVKSLGPELYQSRHQDHNVIVKFGSVEYSLAIDAHMTMRQMCFAILQKLYDMEFANPQECYSIHKEKPSLNAIVHFISQNHSIPTDYYITQLDLPFEVFQQGLRLEACLLTTPLEGRVGLRDFVFIKNIGIGGFSLVYLVKKKDTGKFYALKLIDKEFIIAKKKQQIVMNERNIMGLLNSPFLVHLAYAFESRQFVVFVLEFCQGGELFYQLKKLKRMREEQACFYISEICLGLQELHGLNILYRDIKPENILMDIEGHVRIADFGLSKPEISRDEKAYSFCGSPEYMAPEMLLKQGHSQTVDFYCLGALLYELLTGLPPYYSTDTEQIYQDILYQQLTFPQDVNLSKEVKHLLKSLLDKVPEQRLGARGGIPEILSHPFFKNIDFKLLSQKKLQPPYRPDPLRLNLDEKESQKGEIDFKKKISQGKSSNIPIIFGAQFYYESIQEVQQKSIYKLWQASQLHHPQVGSYHSQPRSSKSQDIIPITQSVKNTRTLPRNNSSQKLTKGLLYKNSLDRIHQEKKFFSKQ